MGGRNTRELTGPPCFAVGMVVKLRNSILQVQCHTSLLATSSLGDGPRSINQCNGRARSGITSAWWTWDQNWDGKCYHNSMRPHASRCWSLDTLGALQALNQILLECPGIRLIPGYSKGQVCTVNGRCNLGSVDLLNLSGQYTWWD